MDRKAQPGEVLQREIEEQPEAVRRQLERGREASEAIADAIRARGPCSVLIAARGSSDNAARYAQYLFGAHNQRMVALATPSLFTLYQRPPFLGSSVAIGISQSGRSPDIVAVLDEARRQGALAVAVTNDAESPLACAADLCLPLHAGPELAVAATKTYTTQLVALAMLSAALEQRPERWAELDGLPAAMARTIEANAHAAHVTARFRYAGRFVVIGRGFNYGTAMEVSLKIKETSYVIAEPYSSADFRHGPSAMLDLNLPVVLVAPSGQVHADVADLLDLCEERNADVIAISDREEVLARSVAPMPLVGDLPEWLTPVAAVVPGQLFALHLARARGLDPDQPRGLRKVTETR